jgi:hypothetical protein
MFIMTAGDCTGDTFKKTSGAYNVFSMFLLNGWLPGPFPGNGFRSLRSKNNPSVSRTLKLVLLLSILSLSSLAQKKNESFELYMREASSPIVIDGVMDESAWLEAEVATDFYMMLPMDTSKANVRTDVRMTYDENNLYLIAINYHAMPGPYMVESLRRDFVFGKNDNFLLFMDPFDDLTNGFSFGANAAGAQWDGIMYEGGKVDLSWDNKWRSQVKNYEDRWVFEMAVPFKSIRYKKGITKWGINFSRLDLKTTEKSSWTPVPRQFPSAALAYTGNLVWDQPPPAAGPNVSIIPYTLGGLTRDYDRNLATERRLDVGADAKIALTSSLNLDLTVNPDFSQVEVDRQVTNLDRFELFFPERRQFFLENGDLFANFGYAANRPFFSRRIGLGVPIQYGARLSGKINKDWRIGIMDMQTDRVDTDQRFLPAQNFAVIALQRRVFARSNIGAIMINKESMGHAAADSAAGANPYNRNIGLEYNLASSNNIWTGKAFFLKSFSPGVTGRDFTHAANLQYNSRKWIVSGQYEYIGSNYNAEVGYVPRRGFVKINPYASRLFFPKGTRVLSHGPAINSTYYTDETLGEITDHETALMYKISFRSQAVLTGWVAQNYVKLLSPFDPTNSGLDSLATGTQHWWKSFGFDYVSKPQSLFTYMVSMRQGGYYQTGSRFNITADVGYRFQPYVSLLLSAAYNDIQLPHPWNNRRFWLIGPRLDVTMTNSLYFTAFAQYNEQQRNVNLNTRLQWRYRPASDLFIVYTDNYFPETFAVRNRAIVVKLTYWWNL